MWRVVGSMVLRRMNQSNSNSTRRLFTKVISWSPPDKISSTWRADCCQTNKVTIWCHNFNKGTVFPHIGRKLFKGGNYMRKYGNLFFGHHFSIPFIVHTVMLLRKSWWEVSATVYVCYYYSILTLCLRAFHIAVIYEKWYFVSKIELTYCEKKICSCNQEMVFCYQNCSDLLWE